MKLTWLGWIILLSFTFLACLKSHELRLWQPFFKADSPIKLHHFSNAMNGLKTEDRELLELWESMLTGRTAPIARWMKDQYKQLGLSHLFTPSGFHLSAILLPIMKVIINSRWRLILLLSLTFGLFQLQGQAALKRMGLIKLSQQWFSQRTGFIVAMLIDLLFGSFQENALSFTYSFLFLGIIYSGVSWTFLWFFLAQALLAYFQGNHISPLLLLLSPILNIGFAFALPILMICAIPLAEWQLETGLWILRLLQYLVSTSAKLCSYFPTWEINLVALFIGLSLIKGKRKWLTCLVFLYCQELNIDRQKQPQPAANEFVPQGISLKQRQTKKGMVVYFSDGRCRIELVRGMWWEKCSPKKRRSTRKKLKKLSYPS